MLKHSWEDSNFQNESVKHGRGSGKNYNNLLFFLVKAQVARLDVVIFKPLTKEPTFCIHTQIVLFWEIPFYISQSSFSIFLMQPRKDKNQRLRNFKSIFPYKPLLKILHPHKSINPVGNQKWRFFVLYRFIVCHFLNFAISLTLSISTQYNWTPAVVHNFVCVLRFHKIKPEQWYVWIKFVYTISEQPNKW